MKFMKQFYPTLKTITRFPKYKETRKQNFAIHTLSYSQKMFIGHLILPYRTSKKDYLKTISW